MLNINKPLQLADGTSAKFIEINRDGYVKVEVDGDFKSFRLFRTDGTHKYGDLDDLINVPAAPAMNVNAPLQLADGTGVTFLYINEDDEIKVKVDGDTKSFRLFNLDGTHKYGVLPKLINTPAAPVMTDGLAGLLASIFGGAGIIIRIG